MRVSASGKWRFPRASARSTETWLCLGERRPLSSSHTAAAAGGTAHAISMSRRCSRRPVWARSCSTFSRSSEADDRRNVFDIRLLASRLQATAEWLAQQTDTKGLALGYFGASTGAGAALLAAASAPESVGAVVSRGGRPDLASDVLPDVTAPTLLIVGGDDEVVLELNREAFNLLTCTRQLDIVPGATHLFPEPGALEEVARLAQEWFVHYLTPGGGRR